MSLFFILHHYPKVALTCVHSVNHLIISRHFPSRSSIICFRNIVISKELCHAHYSLLCFNGTKNGSEKSNFIFIQFKRSIKNGNVSKLKTINTKMSTNVLLLLFNCNMIYNHYEGKLCDRIWNI